MAMLVSDSSSILSAELEMALELFKSGKYPDTAKGIDQAVQSGAPHASALLEALSKRRLYISGEDGTLFYKGSNGAYFKAVDGSAFEAVPSNRKAVRVNNRLRNLISKSLGSLTLGAADPEKRMSAADSLFKSRDVKALPAIAQALKQEQNPDVKQAFERTHAVLILSSQDADEKKKLKAIETLASDSSQDVIPVFNEVAAAGQGEVKVAALSAIRSVERRLKLLEVAQNIWYGLSLGSVLLLAAIGLAITFGVMGVINMAHGEMVMIGAYTTFVVQEVFRDHAPAYFDLSLPLAIPCAFVIAGGVGIAIERGIIRYLYGRPLETLLATWGVSLILQQAVRTIFGPTNREVGAPSYMSGSFDWMGLTITYGRLWIIVFTLVVFMCLLLILRLTPLGLQMRAVTQNRLMASSMGIRTGFVDAMTFGLGSGIAGVAGVALSQIDNVSPNLGQTYIIDSFLVVVFGGVGNLWGTLVSAFSLGVMNKYLEPLTGAVLGKILILVLVILFIQKRPRGLFALKGRAVEI